MALIPVTEATARFGVPPETLRDWVGRGLLPVHRHPVDSTPAEECVDEEQLADLVESMGWLQLSAEHWDDGEDE
jgi:hypothetical protein